MSETPGLPSALGIEAVQWLAQGESVTVRVQGRWRRRRPTSSGQALLVLEAFGQRHRFAAMPEPPSVTGAAPGTWQMSFSVPAPLAPPHAERAWLQLGAVGVPLPLPVDLERERAEPPALETLAERRLRSTELALESARRRTAEAELVAQELARSVSELEDALEAARTEPERLNAALVELDRARRVAEQRAHAERAGRHELQEQLAEREREAVADHTEELAASALRVRELEHEVRRLARVIDEAEHAAKAALASREEAAQLAAGRPLAEGITAERGSLRRSEPAPVGPPAAAPLAHDSKLLSRERTLAATEGPRRRDDRTLAALRGELDARARTEAVLRAELATLKGRLAAEPAPATGIESTLAELRIELDRLSDTIERESSARAVAEQRITQLERELDQHRARAGRASVAIERLRGELAGIGLKGVAETPSEPPGTAPEVSSESPPATVDPERFSAALSRLREASPANALTAGEPGPGEAVEAEPALRSGEWLQRAFRTLTDRDPTSAGALMLALLPAQPLVHPDPIAYDLVLDNGTCVRVTVAEGTAEVETRPRPRQRSEVAFTLIGDPQRIARRLASGSTRRRLLGRRIARIKGDRSEVSALIALIRPPASLAGLLDAGVALDSQLMFELAAAMIDPAWNAGDGFVIAHRTPGSAASSSYLWVRDRARALASADAPQTPVGLTVECAEEDLAPLLAGAGPDEVVLDGESRLLDLIRAWLERAQRP